MVKCAKEKQVVPLSLWPSNLVSAVYGMYLEFLCIV